MTGFKKWTLLSAYLVIFLFSLTACRLGIVPNSIQLEKENPEPKTLVLWSQWVDMSDTVSNPLKNAITEWNEKNPGVQLSSFRWNGEQYKSRIKTALAAGEAPDMFYMWSGSFAGPYIDEGNILPLDSYLHKETLDRILPGSIDSCIYNGKIYSLPTYRYMANLYCNTELFNKVGAKIPTTYDELLEAVKKLRSGGILPIVVGEKDRWPGMYWYDILAIRQAGIPTCRNALTIPSQFDGPDFMDAAAKLVQLVDNNAFNGDAFNTSYKDMVSEFVNGNAAMIYQGNFVDSDIEDVNSKVKGKVIALPFPAILGGKGQLTEFYGGITDGYFINANTQYKQDAVNVLEFISEKSGKEGYKSGAGLPCWKMDGFDNSKLPPLIKQTTQLMENGTTYINWWDTILSTADAEKHKELVAELFDKRLSPEEFAKRMTQLRGTGL